MGVHGLWKLIDAAGKPVPVETLENRILAVDVSIWLHQLVKGFTGLEAGSGANAHLLGLFYRICKLLFFRIKPVFIFDGGVPALKRKTIAARQSSRSKASESLEKIRQELLQNLLKQHALGKILGEHVKIPKSIAGKQDNMFFLPPMPSSAKPEESVVTAADWEESEEESEYSDSSYEENSPSKKYGDIHSIDVNSKEFKALPADIRHDILSELKETRKQNSWAKVHLMPEDVGSFSSFQMDRLLKRRSVQVGLEAAEKEMGPRCFTVSEIQEILEYQGVDVKDQSKELQQRIASDSTTRFIYSTQKKPDSEKASQSKAVTLVEELDSSEEDDPLLDALKANEDLPQEDILKLIKEEQAKKNVKGILEDCGKQKEYVNDLIQDEIRTDLEPGKISESMTSNKQKTFDSKQVTQLLKDNAQKTLLPISKFDKVLEGKKRKFQKRKIVRKVSNTGPNLSESSSDSGEETISNIAPISSSESDKETFEENRKSNLESESMATVLSETSESDNDFEEVQNQNSSSIDISSSVTNIKETPTNENSEEKTISLELNFDKPLSDEDDIFADIFKKPDDIGSERVNSRVREEKIESISPKEDKPKCLSDKSKSINFKINVDKPLSDEEDIFADIFEQKSHSNVISSKILVQKDESKFDSVKYQSINITKDEIGDTVDDKSKLVVDEIKPEVNVLKSKKASELSSFINPKESERAVILEELLMTKKKLEEELNSDIDDPMEVDSSVMKPVSSESDVEEVKEEKLTETQESLEEKKYFSDDNAYVESDKKEHKSPNSFAQKLSTVEQVRQFQSTLERESSSLIREKRRDEKVAASLSEQITVEAQELLKMFGIPYLVAPMEAEAQCAFLDANGLTQGTITDDSDIWLFGANNVYKNFFDQKKYVKLFKSSDIRKVYNLGRDELIMLGLLVGSDYTSGLNGVGPVTALEILANFPQEENDIFPPKDRLSRFASAFTQHKLTKKLAKKLLPVQLIEGFPSIEVVRAYTEPVVDENKETFSWGAPDVERIREYAIDKFGWDQSKTDKTLEPIIDKLKQNKTQMTLHGFFEWAFDKTEGKMSKRVESAVQLLGTSPEKRTQHQIEDDPDDPQEVKKEKVKRNLNEEKSKKRKTKKTQPSDEPMPSTSSILQPSNQTPGPSCEAASTSHAGPSHESIEDILNDEAIARALAQDDFDDYTQTNLTSSSSKSNPKDLVGLAATMPRINETIQKLRKGKSLSAKPRARVARDSVSLTRPHNELDFDAPFGTGETRKRKKVFRTDEEKLKEIEEARAKAARVIAKLKNTEQFHANH